MVFLITGTLKYIQKDFLQIHIEKIISATPCRSFVIFYIFLRKRKIKNCYLIVFLSRNTFFHWRKSMYLSTLGTNELKSGMRIRFWPNIGSGVLHLKQRKISKILLNEYFRKVMEPSYLFFYFWCQTSFANPRAPDPVRILPDPGWFSESRISMELTIHSIEFQKSPFVRGTEPRIRFLGRNRILIPG